MASDLADDRDLAAVGGPVEPVSAVESARDAAPGLHSNGAGQRPDRTAGPVSTRLPQRADPPGHRHCAGDPGLFGGAIFTETIFNWPGMGQLLIGAVGAVDWPVAMGVVIITAGLTFWPISSPTWPTSSSTRASGTSAWPPPFPSVQRHTALQPRTRGRTGRQRPGRAEHHLEPLPAPPLRADRTGRSLFMVLVTTLAPLAPYAPERDRRASPTRSTSPMGSRRRRGALVRH